MSPLMTIDKVVH